MSWSTLAGAGEGSGETGPGRRCVPARAARVVSTSRSAEREVLVEMLGGCSYNGHHWVFAASATDMGLVLMVRDTVTGAIKDFLSLPHLSSSRLRGSHLRGDA